MYYIQETDKPNFILKLFNIVKLKENKIILPIEAEEKMDLKKSKVLANKTKKILSKTNCNKVILSKEIKKQQDYQNYLYTYNFDIIDGRWLFEVLMLKSLKYIIEKKNMKKEARKMSFSDERKCCISASFGLISRRPFHYNVLVVRK